MTSDGEQNEMGYSFATSLLLCGFIANCLSLANLSVVVVGGPMLVNICGSLKDFVLTYVGFVLFKDDSNTTKCTTLVLIGLSVSFLGAIYTLITKFKNSRSNTEE